jgi:transketolase
MENQEILKKRILELSKKHKLSHISSCLSLVPVISEVYTKKRTGDLVILDNAHAHLAHLAIQEQEAKEAYELGMGVKFDAEALLEKNGIHCDRSVGCDASGGSLGHGVGIAIGYCLANPDRRVFVIVSDGSMHEGSNWEALRIAGNLKLKNLEIHANFNGYTAVEEIDRVKLGSRMLAFWPVVIHHTENGEGYEGVEGHYKTV